MTEARLPFCNHIEKAFLDILKVHVNWHLPRRGGVVGEFLTEIEHSPSSILVNPLGQCGKRVAVKKKKGMAIADHILERFECHFLLLEMDGNKFADHVFGTFECHFLLIKMDGNRLADHSLGTSEAPF